MYVIDRREALETRCPHDEDVVASTDAHAPFDGARSTKRLLPCVVVLSWTVALLACGAGPGRPSFAPRFPNAARAPVAAAHVHVIVDPSRPPCAYDVIGTVFATSRDELGGRAAAVGADGVYDIQCVIHNDGGILQVQLSDCAGRVYACRRSSP